MRKEHFISLLIATFTYWAGCTISPLNSFLNLGSKLTILISVFCIFNSPLILTQKLLFCYGSYQKLRIARQSLMGESSAERSSCQKYRGPWICSSSGVWQVSRVSMSLSKFLNISWHSCKFTEVPLVYLLGTERSSVARAAGVRIPFWEPLYKNPQKVRGKYILRKKKELMHSKSSFH